MVQPRSDLFLQSPIAPPSEVSAEPIPEHAATSLSSGGARIIPVQSKSRLKKANRKFASENHSLRILCDALQAELQAAQQQLLDVQRRLANVLRKTDSVTKESSVASDDTSVTAPESHPEA